MKITWKPHARLTLWSCVAVTPLGKTLTNLLRNASRESRWVLRIYGVWDAALPVALVFLSAMALAGNSYNPFLYFQF